MAGERLTPAAVPFLGAAVDERSGEVDGSAWGRDEPVPVAAAGDREPPQRGSVVKGRSRLEKFGCTFQDQRREERGSMGFDVHQIMNLVGQLGGNHQQAAQQLQGMGQVDPQQDAGLLSNLGVDTQQLQNGGYQQHFDAQQQPGFNGYQPGQDYTSQQPSFGGGYDPQQQGGYDPQQGGQGGFGQQDFNQQQSYDQQQQSAFNQQQSDDNQQGDPQQGYDQQQSGVNQQNY